MYFLNVEQLNYSSKKWQSDFSQIAEHRRPDVKLLPDVLHAKILKWKTIKAVMILPQYISIGCGRLIEM